MSATAKKLLGEFLACVFLGLFGLGYVAALYLGYVGSLTELGVWFGIVFAIAVLIFSPVSGTHVTPGVTISYAIHRGFEKKLVLPYILVQVLGWGVGVGLIYLVFGNLLTEGVSSYGMNPVNLFYCSPTEGYFWSSVTVEFFSAFIMMVGIYAVTDPRLPLCPGTTLIPIAVGAVIMISVAFGGGVAGGALNFARDLGPRITSWIVGKILGYDTSAIFANGYWLMYIIVDTLGALCGGLVFHKVFLKLLPAAEK